MSAAATAHRPMGAAAAATMVLLCAIWALGQISIKVGVQGISPLWQAGLRSLGAAVLVGAWTMAHGIRLRPERGRAGWSLAIGVAFALEFVLLYRGIELTTAARGSLLLFTAPFFVAIGGHRLLADPLTPTRLAGLALAFVGVGLALSEGGSGGDLGHGDWRGDLMCLGAGVAWAATTLMIKGTSLRTEPAERALFAQLAVSAPLLLAASVARGEPGVFAPGPLVWAAFAWQVLAVASFSYLCWFVLIRRHSPASLSAFSFLTPLFGVAFAALLLREPLTPTLVAAAALIAGGILLVNRR